MFFPFFYNTKIICCGLVINRSKYHYQFQERVQQETQSKQSSSRAARNKMVKTASDCWLSHNVLWSVALVAVRWPADLVAGWRLTQRGECGGGGAVSRWPVAGRYSGSSHR